MGGIPTIAAYGLPTESDLPSNVAGWRPDPERAVLLVHDMQRYFLRPLPEPTRGRLVVQAARLRAACVAGGVPIVYTRQPGGMTESQRGLLRAFWGAGMRTTPEDREIVPELAPSGADTVLDKWRYSAFARTDLLDRMRAIGRDQLVVCGVYAHVGVLVTAVEAFSHDLETFVAADAVADFSERHHRMALDYAAARCAVVAGTGALVDDLRPAAVAS